MRRGFFSKFSMRVLGIGICLGFLVACGKVGPDPEGPGEDDPPVTPENFSLTVATYNVLKPSGRRDEMSLAQDAVRTALGSAIVATGADLIGFNELDADYISTGKYALNTLCTGAPASWKWSLNYRNKIYDNYSVGYSYANGFAYNSSVLTLKKSGYVWLSKGNLGWYTDPDRAYSNSGNPERTCVWALFRHNASRAEFYFFVTHLPTESQGGGANMASVVNSFASSKAGDAPHILCGDMNSAPGSNETAYTHLKSYWADAYEKVSSIGQIGEYATSQGTLSGSSKSYYYSIADFADGHPERRIDHIMTRGNCAAASYATIKTTYTYQGKTWCPSDHLPVVATIDFEF